MRFGARELLFLLVLIGMPLAAWWFVFRPTNDQIEQVRTEIREKSQKLKQLEEATAQLDDLGREIDRLSDAIAVFEAKLPAEREVDVILTDISQLSSRYGLKTISFKTDKPIEQARHTELPLNLVIVGDFDGFYSFLLDVERLSRITRIKEMKLEKLKKGEEGQMEATFKLSIFFEPKSREAAEPAEKA